MRSGEDLEEDKSTLGASVSVRLEVRGARQPKRDLRKTRTAR
jgi:hypothetical protein